MYGCKYSHGDILEIGELKYRISIEQDEAGITPEEWGDDNVFLGMVSTRDCRIGNKNFDFDTCQKCHVPWGFGRWDTEDLSPSEVQEARDDYEFYHDSTYTSFPVMLINHGGGCMRLYLWDHEDFVKGRNRYRATNPDGYVLVKYPEDPLQQMAFLTGSGDKTPEDLAKMLVDTWNQYLEGDVYVVMICEGDWVDGEWVEGKHVECCGGIYGAEGVEDYIEDHLDWLRKRAANNAE